LFDVDDRIHDSNKNSWEDAMFYRSILAAAVAAGAITFLSGCASGIHSRGEGNYPDRNEVPIAANFSTTTQLKLQGADHWRRVAADSAENLVKAMRRGGGCLPQTGCATLFVKRPCETTGCNAFSCETAFSKVFFNDFVTALVNLGYPVSTLPAVGATTIEIDIQAVAFAENRPQYRYAGEPVELGPGVWALRDNSSLVDSAGGVALRTTSPDTNWYRAEFAGGPTPRNELVITASAMSPARTYMARDTKVYYTSDSDSAHYFCQGNQAQDSSTRSRTWSVPVKGDCSPGRCIAPEGRR
jgi:hypothetical protein